MCLSSFLGARCATCDSVESMFGHSVRRTVGSFWLSSCEFGFCQESSPFESSFHDSECSTADSLCGSLLKHGHGVIFDRANPYLLLRDESTKSVH